MLGLASCVQGPQFNPQHHRREENKEEKEEGETLGFRCRFEQSKLEPWKPVGVNLEFLCGKVERVRIFKSGRPLCKSQPSRVSLRKKSFPLTFHVHEMGTILCDLELCLFVLNLIN